MTAIETAARRGVAHAVDERLRRLALERVVARHLAKVEPLAAMRNDCVVSWSVGDLRRRFRQVRADLVDELVAAESRE